MAALCIGDSVNSFSRRSRLTCYHGEEDKWPPHNEAILRDGKEMVVSMEKFYVEAARRLPLDEIPELFDCICKAGHCIGLADPVSNIILNAISQLSSPSPSGGAHSPSPPRKRRRRTSAPGRWQWEVLAYASNFGLFAFMAEYFKYLTEIQARRYLHATSYDLSLAIKLVLHERSSSKSQRCLLPDGGKIKAALRIAALQAGHPAPDDLAGLMTAQYPSGLLSHNMPKLQGHELLSPGDVWAIRDLLKSQWPPTPLPNLDILCHPNGNTSVQSTVDSVLLLLSSCIGDDLCAQISMANRRHLDSLQLGYMSDLTFDSPYMETKLSNFLVAAARMRSGRLYSTVDYDGIKCEHILSLKMCLLDSIHALYIKALTIVPISSGDFRFLRALLIAGHCYGPMDPVSNIILNSIWYDIAFPLREEHIEAQGDILDSSIMSRLETRSLNGLVALFRTSHSSSLSEHEILEHLYFWNCDLSRLCKEAARDSSIPFADVAKAAKHPQYFAFGSLLMSLSPVKLTHLRSLLVDPAGGRISHAHWIMLRETIHELIACNAVLLGRRDGAPCYLHQEVCLEISRKKSAFRDRMAFVRTELDKVLREYCKQHPEEPNYQLDIICGVHMESRSHTPPRFYHAIFLASAVAANGDIIQSRERTLFFAEFWELPWDPRPSSSIWYPGYAYHGCVPYGFASSCCPVYDYDACIGRCYDCEVALRKIVHPPSGSHSGNKVIRSIEQYQSLFDYAIRKVDNGGFERLLDSDYIYFDPDRDVKLGKTMNDIWEQETEAMGFFQPPNC